MSFTPEILISRDDMDMYRIAVLMAQAIGSSFTDFEGTNVNVDNNNGTETIVVMPYDPRENTSLINLQVLASTLPQTAQIIIFTANPEIAQEEPIIKKMPNGKVISVGNPGALRTELVRDLATLPTPPSS